MKNVTVIRPNGTISSEQARRLLRRVRDLNLGPCGIEVRDNERITVAGCLSLDHPVEMGVRYSLHEDSGRERVLGLSWNEGRLVIELIANEADGSIVSAPIDVELGCDGLGRIAAPGLGARLHLANADAREVEHFLRRVVRAVYSRAS